MHQTHLLHQISRFPSTIFPLSPTLKRLATLIALAIFARFGAPAQAHFAELNPWVNNQRPAPAPIVYPSAAPTPSPQADAEPANAAPVPAPSPEEVAQQQQHAAALATNDQGCDAYTNGDWSAAIKFFESALQAEPNNTTFRDNLTNAHTAQGCDAFAKHDWTVAASDFNEAIGIEPDNQTSRNDLASAYSCQADDAQNNGDYQAAIDLFQKALASNPANAASIQSQLDAARGRLQNKQQDRITSANMQRSVEEMVGGLTPVPAASTMETIEPPVVDARNVPTGVTRAIDTAIADAYSNAPAGVADRVSKGFQSVATQDWPVAKAWFQDALNRDPENADLKSLVALADYTAERKQQTAKLDYVALSALTPPPPTDSQLSDSAPEVVNIQNQMLNRQLDDFYYRYLPDHPDLMVPPGSPPPNSPASPADAPPSAWQRLLQFVTPHHPVHNGGYVGGVRD